MAKANMRQKLFAEAYIALKGNGQEAARKAGYKGSDAALRVQATRLLTNANVKSMIEQRTEKALVRVGSSVSPEEVLATLGEQMRGEKPSKWRVDDKEFNPQGAAALLGKFLGMEKPAPESPGNTTINLLQVFGHLDAATVEQIRAATLKALPATVEAG